MGLKGMSSYGLRGRRLFVTLIAMMCMSVIFWASERTPQITTLHPPKDRMNRVSHDTHLDYPTDDVIPQMDKWLLKKPKLESRKGVTDTSIAMQPADSLLPSSRFESTEYRKLKSAPAGKKDCNYAKGEWVADDRRPLYSGAECKQWLSEMWACRLTQRTDFSFEAFRWQPDYCEMPDFESSLFFKRMKGKTMAFVGDSLGRQQFQSLMCMVTGGKLDTEVEDVGEEYGFVMTPGSARPNGWAYRFPTTNTTILYHWSATLCELEPLNVSDPMTSVAMHLDRPAAFLQQYLHKLDVLVLNTGHHWNRGKLNGNRWEMFAEGSPIEDKYLKMIGNAKNFTIHNVVRWLDNELPRHPRLKAFLRSISPRHFFNGEWNTGGSCDNTSPLAHGSRVSHYKSDDLLAASAVRGTNVKLLDVTALSQLRDEGHISKYSIKSSSGVHDCLHWCLPGIPDAWNEILYAQL